MNLPEKAFENHRKSEPLQGKSWVNFKAENQAQTDSSPHPYLINLATNNKRSQRYFECLEWVNKDRQKAHD